MKRQEEGRRRKRNSARVIEKEAPLTGSAMVGRHGRKRCDYLGDGGHQGQQQQGASCHRGSLFRVLLSVTLDALAVQDCSIMSQNSAQLSTWIWLSGACHVSTVGWKAAWSQTWPETTRGSLVDKGDAPAPTRTCRHSNLSRWLFRRISQAFTR